MQVQTRSMRASDLTEVSELIEGFVAGHKAAAHPRPLARLRDACLGPDAVFRVIVAGRGGRLVGFVCWSRTFDFAWSKWGGIGEWLYVRPESRGFGVAMSLVARMCADIRASGGEFLRGWYVAELAEEYEFLAVGHSCREGHVSAASFNTVADLADLDVRGLVRGLRPLRRRSERSVHPAHRTIGRV